MKDTFLKTITNIKKSGELEIIRHNFSNQIISNLDLQCFLFVSVRFLNCEFQNVTVRKSQYWDCTLKNTQIYNSNWTRAEFYDSSFTNCKFLGINLRASDFSECKFKETNFFNSNLDLILVEDVKIWESEGWVEIKDFSYFDV